MTIRTLLVPSILGLAIFAGAAQAAAPLRPPQGYFAAVDKVKSGDSSEGCDAMPQPYTGQLQFRSKYEGSDKARATLNVQSEQAFRDSTSDITSMERGTSKQVMQFMRDGRPQELNCTLNWLTAWAQAHAQMGPGQHGRVLYPPEVLRLASPGHPPERGTADRGLVRQAGRPSGQRPGQ